MKKIIGYKGTKWFIGILILAVLALLGFIAYDLIVFGWEQGWIEFASWFTSRWARILYLFIPLYIIAFVVYLWMKKNQERN